MKLIGEQVLLKLFTPLGRHNFGGNKLHFNLPSDNIIRVDEAIKYFY
ncbi:hypothetical protein T06_6191 [Trichinella sp. T6]|nr:hypothetical protein T06_6191 [Trichinella sp. T6]